jgi:hypothetical protein
LKQNAIIHLITGSAKTTDDIEIVAGYTYEIVSYLSKYQLIKAFFSMACDFHPDIVICIEPITLIAGYWIKKKLKSRLVFDCHEFYTEAFYEKNKILYPLYKCYDTNISKKVDAIITVNELLVESYKKVNKNVFMCKNYPNINSFNPNPVEKIYDVIYAGLLSFERGLKLYLETAKLFRDENKPLQFCIIGSFTNSNVELYFFDFIAKHKLSDIILYKPYMPHEQVLTEIKKARLGIFMADVHLAPRYAKATNVKAYDYMTQSIPFLINSLTILNQTIIAANCGWIIEYDKNKFCSILSGILNDQDTLLSKGSNGYEYCLKNHLWENQEPDLYRAVFGER